MSSKFFVAFMISSYIVFPSVIDMESSSLRSISLSLCEPCFPG
uniref:Uncharacterized protein n=1 Tax=Rhizophora mucronata TaxID=61149 RepID=A0A2P2J5Z6_RHIMU